MVSRKSLLNKFYGLGQVNGAIISEFLNYCQVKKNNRFCFCCSCCCLCLLIARLRSEAIGNYESKIHKDFEPEAGGCTYGVLANFQKTCYRHWLTRYLLLGICF